MITILDPTAPPPTPPRDDLGGDGQTSRPRSVSTLSGARVAVLTNRWKSMDAIAEQFARRLPAEHGAASVRVHAIPLNGGAPGTLLDEIAASAEVAVVGLAN
jgi:hypothetical protein